MSAPERPGAPRGDDDSWGKLASDLFGIKLDDDEDLDISDLVPPVVVPASPPPVTPPPPVVSEAVDEIDLADMDFDSDDEDEDEPDEAEEEEFVSTERSESRALAPTADEVQFDEEDEDEGDEEAAESAAAAPDDFWDALESWDWEPGGETESADAGKAPRSSEGRDRRSRDRDRGGSRRGDRSEERGSRRERGPEREGRRPKSESRDRSDSPPRRERRPESSAEEAGRPPRKQPASGAREEISDDEFGAGLVEEARRGMSAPRREEPPAIEQRAERSADRGELVDDDFAVDLGPEEFEPGEATAGDAGAEPSRPRRRRRRRRRRSGEDRDSRVSSAGGDAGEFPSHDAELGDEGVEEREPSAESVEESPEPSRESSRGERGGRRRRRRPEGRPPRTESAGPHEEADFGEADDAWEAAEEERVVATRYDDIPTWEEAIGCLLKARGDGGHRSGPPRRR